MVIWIDAFSIAALFAKNETQRKAAVLVVVNGSNCGTGSGFFVDDATCEWVAVAGVALEQPFPTAGFGILEVRIGFDAWVGFAIVCVVVADLHVVGIDAVAVAAFGDEDCSFG